MCVSVSKLCFHLGLIAAIGEGRFMMGISAVFGKLYHGDIVVEWLGRWT